MHSSYTGITFSQHAGGRQRQSFAILLSSNSEYTCCMIDQRSTEKLGGERAGRYAAKEVLQGIPNSVFFSILLHQRMQSPVKSTEIDKPDTQMNKDYLSIQEKRRVKDQHISEVIHALKLYLRNKGCAYFPSLCSSKGIEQLRLRQPTPG